MDRIKVSREEGNFFMVYKEAFQNKDLSLKARGLLATIMSLPSSWDFNIEGLEKILKEGKTAIYSTINELIEEGYCIREQVRDKGKILGNEYHFFEKKGNVGEFEPHMENPNMVNQDMGNQPQYNIPSNKKIINKERYAEFVSMTPEEYNKLVSQYGESATKGFIQILNNYKGSKGKTYKNDYLAILSWVVGEYEKRNPVVTKTTNAIDIRSI